MSTLNAPNPDVVIYGYCRPFITNDNELNLVHQLVHEFYDFIFFLKKSLTSLQQISLSREDTISISSKLKHAILGTNNDLSLFYQTEYLSQLINGWIIQLNAQRNIIRLNMFESLPSILTKLLSKIQICDILFDFQHNPILKNLFHNGLFCYIRNTLRRYNSCYDYDKKIFHQIIDILATAIMSHDLNTDLFDIICTEIFYYLHYYF